MELEVFDLGLLDFSESLNTQKELFQDVLCGRLRHALILCRHYPVITLGRQAKAGKNIRVAPGELIERGISICNADRGGDVTYHGPGQITAYPIFNLACIKKDINLFLRRLEQVIMDLLSDLGLNGRRGLREAGVWVAEEKVCSIGIGVKGWVTFHGLSLNVADNDLVHFDLIRPCGKDIRMASIEGLLGREIDIEGIKESMILKFSEVYGITAHRSRMLTQEAEV